MVSVSKQRKGIITSTAVTVTLLNRLELCISLLIRSIFEDKAEKVNMKPIQKNQGAAMHAIVQTSSDAMLSSMLNGMMVADIKNVPVQIIIKKRG